MEPNLNAILTIGSSGLRAFQDALSVTSHNIANAQTPGYSRQVIDMTEAFPITVPSGQFGEGVQVTDVSRVRDSLLDNNYRTALGQQSKYDTASQNATAIEGVFGDINGSNLNSQMSDFFNSFQDLTTSPQDLSVRQSVLDKANALATGLNTASTGLTQQTANVDTAVNAAATDINSTLTQIASLNSSIMMAKNSGVNAPDMQDQRDVLLDKLSSYMDLTITNNSNGSVDVAANGQTLVTGITSSNVAVASVGVPAHPQIQSSGGVSLVTNGGSLAGFQQSYQDIDNTRSQLDNITSTLINQVNALHAGPGAVDLNGNPGLNLFTGTDSATIAVNPALVGNPAMVVAGNSASQGNNAVALQITQLQDAKVYPAGSPTSTLNDAFTNLISNTGSTTNTYNQLSTNYQSAATAIQNQRQSVSGVNTDEELTNMLSFQRAYEAAAKVINMADEMMTTVINMKSGA